MAQAEEARVYISHVTPFPDILRHPAQPNFYRMESALAENPAFALAARGGSINPIRGLMVKIF
jgi:hypothetical protein